MGFNSFKFKGFFRHVSLLTALFVWKCSPVCVSARLPLLVLQPVEQFFPHKIYIRYFFCSSEDRNVRKNVLIEHFRNFMMEKFGLKINCVLVTRLIEATSISASLIFPGNQTPPISSLFFRSYVSKFIGIERSVK